MAEEQRRSRKRKRGRRHGGKNISSGVVVTNNESSSVTASSGSGSPIKSSSKSTSSFLDKMKARLSGGYFRMINEKLYTCSGDEALQYFKEDPSLFNVYHSGYQAQMSLWPEQPNDIIIKWIKDRSPSLVVADFGCGDARLARSVKNKVFSFDLVSNDPSVIACDMSHTPLDSSSVDVAVFCLSLMGTNFPSYLQEANRVLKPLYALDIVFLLKLQNIYFFLIHNVQVPLALCSGWLLIAEVKSRFDPNSGGADPNKFVKAICELGFTSASKDFSNKMFILFYFQKKEKQKPKDIKWPKLKPCLYKRR